MDKISQWIAIVITIGVASLACGGDRFVMSLQSEGQVQDRLQHVSMWLAQANRADVELQWKCTTFRSESDKVRASDTRITMDVVRTKGQFKASTRSDTSRTDIARQITTACVSTGISGIGEVLFRLTLDLLDPYPAGVSYYCKVELTITGR